MTRKGIEGRIEEGTTTVHDVSLLRIILFIVFIVGTIAGFILTSLGG